MMNRIETIEAIMKKIEFTKEAKTVLKEGLKAMGDLNLYALAFELGVDVSKGIVS